MRCQARRSWRIFLNYRSILEGSKSQPLILSSEDDGRDRRIVNARGWPLSSLPAASHCVSKRPIWLGDAAQLTDGLARRLMPGPAMPAIVVVVGRPAANAVRFTMRDITVIANSSRGAAAVGGRMTPMRY
jgi:hypothetical protein